MTKREKIRRQKVIGTLVTKENKHSEQSSATVSPSPKLHERDLNLLDKDLNALN